MTRYKAYADYKDSGGEWFDVAPLGWMLMQAKFAFVLQRGHDLSSDEMIEGDYLVYGSNGAIGTHNEFTTESPGITVGRSGSVGEINYINQNFWAHNTSLYVKDYKGSPQRFIYYLLIAINPKRLSAGSAVGTLDRNNIHSQIIALPSLFEQNIIANFLDHETAKIDALIEKQQQLIKLLKEKRQAVISHAVTKGLNPNAPMRDSGVESLGQVPAHWTVINMDYALNAIGDVDHYMPQSIEKGIPYLMTGDLKEFASAINFDDCKQVSHNDYLSLSKKIKSSKGDVIMARYATVGTVTYVDVDADFLVSYSCVTIKSNLSKAIGLYLFYYFKSDAFLQGIQSQINTNTQGNVGVYDLKKIKIALPTLAEQSKIIKYLQSRISQFDSLSERMGVAIKLSQERRTALISAAVTGKIDVRDWQPSSTSTQPKAAA